MAGQRVDAVFAATLAAAWTAEGRAAVADPSRRRASPDAVTWHHRAVERSAAEPSRRSDSPVRRAGDWVITSGQVGLASNGSGARRRSRWTLAELRQAFQNVAEVLAVEGETLADVVKTTLYASTWASSLP